MQRISFVAIIIAMLGIHIGPAEERRPVVVFAGPNISSITFRVNAKTGITDRTLSSIIPQEIRVKDSPVVAGFTGGIGFKPKSFPGSTLALSYTYHGKSNPAFERTDHFIYINTGDLLDIHYRMSGPLHVHTLDLVGRWEIFDNDNAFQPYLSAALGAAHVRGKLNLALGIDVNNTLTFRAATPSYSFQKTAFVGGVGGGFRYTLTDKISMTADYLFKASSTMKQRVEGVDYDLRMNIHQVSLGFHLTF